MWFTSGMFTSTKYRIYPTAEQEVALSKHFGCVRWVFNWALACKKEAWESRGENLSSFLLSKRLPEMKRKEETAWLKEVNAQSLQSALSRLDAAYARFFREKKGFPKFKSKHDRQSFQVPQSGEVGEDYVKIPKVGKMRARISRPVEGNIKTITISKTPTGKYFASVLSEFEHYLPEKLPVTEAGTVGIDLGLAFYATLSTGEKVTNPRPLKLALRRLRRSQRKMSRRAIGSCNRNKQRQIVARIHERVTNIRKDFLHKLTTRLVRDNQTDSFAIEDLAVGEMLQNRRLARSIADAGWGEFRRQLEYKAERAGKNVLIVSRFEPSSKTDHKTGAYLPELKLSDRVIRHADGSTTCRDLNAAINIRNFALRNQGKIGRDAPEYTLGETAQISGSLNQESQV